jgi:hypothetical protein
VSFLTELNLPSCPSLKKIFLPVYDSCTGDFIVDISIDIFIIEDWFIFSIMLLHTPFPFLR